MSIPSKKFQRHKESFTCQVCLTIVSGNGYTNHCPECLWSIHVDIHPGDRASLCRGLMKPIDILSKGNDLWIVHKCLKCDLVKKNKRQKEDQFESILNVIKNKLQT